MTTTPPPARPDVSATTLVRATFSEAIDPATVTASTVELRTTGGALVTATCQYDAASGIATLTPAAPLTANATYTARVHGGAIDPTVRDVAGNALGADVSWSFTVAPLPTAFVDTSVADFNRGTLDSGGYDRRGDRRRPDAWRHGSAPNSAALCCRPDGRRRLGRDAVGDGRARRDERRWRPRGDGLAVSPPLTSLEFTATFSGAPYQHAGFARDLRRGAVGDVQQRRRRRAVCAHNGGQAARHARPRELVRGPHRYRIDWGASPSTTPSTASRWRRMPSPSARACAR